MQNIVFALQLPAELGLHFVTKCDLVSYKRWGKKHKVKLSTH